MDKSNNRIVVGRFGRIHGIKGYITIHSFTEPRDNILQYSDWSMFVNRQWQPVELLDIQVQKKSFIALVKGCETRELASLLTNADIAVSRYSLPDTKPGEYYWHDLIGLQVIDNQGNLLGKVKEIMPTGANDVLVVMGEKRYLIPYLPETVIKHVDLEQGLINVDWDVDY